MFLECFLLFTFLRSLERPVGGDSLILLDNVTTVMHI
jgi:hypothetical protein